MGVNKAILVGRLGQDPEIRVTSGQLQITTLNLATGERRKDASGNWVDHTEWHRIVYFGKLAEVAGQYLKKGSEVYVEGRITTRKWQDKDNVTRYTTEIVGDKVEFLGGRSSNNNQSMNYETGPTASPQEISTMMSSLKSADSITSPQAVPFEEDDIPF